MKAKARLYRMLSSNKVFNVLVLPVYRGIKSLALIPGEFRIFKEFEKRLSDLEYTKKRIYYMGAPAHANLGDLAQGVCIRNWLRKYYSDYDMIEIETNSLVNTHFSLIPLIKKVFKIDEDIILFQSGYTTTDLGGYADDMHCEIIRNFNSAHFLMMPQTIFFRSNERRERTSNIYNSAKNMLFLARDSVSYQYATDMFPDIAVRMFPDIVTTLIGTYKANSVREGILFCCRDDDERFYSEKEINVAVSACQRFAVVKKTDTTKYKSEYEIINNAEKYVMKEVTEYAKYKVIITDRYHGTIFSLIAGTPVIIIKTTDHKVTTGADWFKGIYDDHVYVADTLEEACRLAREIYFRNDIHYQLEPYFETTYYAKLRGIFESISF